MSHWIEQSNSIKEITLSDFLDVTKKGSKKTGTSTQKNGVKFCGNAGVCHVDGIETVVDNSDISTILGDIELEIADGPSSFEAMLEPIMMMQPGKGRHQDEFADDFLPLSATKANPKIAATPKPIIKEAFRSRPSEIIYVAYTRKPLLAKTFLQMPTPN
jgi:hypothetical protein